MAYSYCCALLFIKLIVLKPIYFIDSKSFLYLLGIPFQKSQEKPICKKIPTKFCYIYSDQYEPRAEPGILMKFSFTESGLCERGQAKIHCRFHLFENPPRCLEKGAEGSITRNKKIQCNFCVH